MDRLDRFSILAIVVLIISSSALISHHMGKAKSDRNSQQQMRAIGYPVIITEVEDKVKAVKNVIEGNSLNKAEMLVKELIKKYPYEGELRMLMGDIHMRKQEPLEAAIDYKEAIDLNPDYLDKKTPLFQGKKLSVAVKEAMTEIEKEIKANSEDKVMTKYRKDIYYLQRRIAGSCG